MPFHNNTNVNKIKSKLHLELLHGVPQNEFYDYIKEKKIHAQETNGIRITNPLFK